MKDIKAIAFYLPQFHPVEDNNKWWGNGFTEWTNVGKAKKYFKTHYQPRIPKDLGYYDLRVAETRKAQAEMAKEHGIDAFCYWHYWFGNGKRLLERPLHEVVAINEPDFPFCLGWANESWKGFAHGLKNRNTLIEQLYPGKEDIVNHFYTMLDTFKDKRYLRIEEKLVFLIYKPLADCSIKDFIRMWRALAKENDLNDFYFIGHINNLDQSYDEVLNLGFDAVNTVRIVDFMKNDNLLSRVANKFIKRMLRRPNYFTYSKASKYFYNNTIDNLENVIPSLITGWDHTPRSGKEGLVLTNYTPKSFKEHIEYVFENVSKKENKLIFVKSWNEWAEGNYLEPDLKFGRQFLEIFKDVKIKYLNR
ncbi:glycosyltransferase WbsX family protein [Paenimyroides viscosum]|uniref:Lipopolysaccharide biosynthesis protein n=1 Tax=Paenimyroides viscosum TaxID=2488729 RepID=A0A3P1AN59_9FLAO|nr:glycoside hydrolase family 99-like domain-containing protein [Paenimyroides viscosum]RRA90386.1 lipopolysaccharide biosynthesis protein [Paenimyroides viscosum]